MSYRVTYLRTVLECNSPEEAVELAKTISEKQGHESNCPIKLGLVQWRAALAQPDPPSATTGEGK